jgi:endogenous inhibitor of DNA gyrase (YacG/DUF329 family)
MQKTARIKKAIAAGTSVVKQCPVCGKTFVVTHRSRQVFCDKKCLTKNFNEAYKYRKREIRAAHKAEKMKENKK